MQRLLSNTWTIIIISALLTGIISNSFLPAFSSSLLLAVGTALAMGLTVIGFIFDLVTKSYKGIRLTGFIFLFFLIAFLTCFTSMLITQSLAVKLSNKVIHALYSYKQQEGHFPSDINTLQLDDRTKAAFTRNQHYQADYTLEHFEIVSYSDGWNTKTFHSKDSTWVTTD